MDDFVRCKACGYITTRKRLGTVCPACGVPAKMFEAYKHPLSAARRIPLDLHTHPVAVHFPQAFCLILFLLSLAVAMLPEHHFVRDLYSTQKVLALILPFFVLLSFATGLYDAKLRFRKWTTPFLQKKIFLGGLLFFHLAGAVRTGRIGAVGPQRRDSNPLHAACGGSLFLRGASGMDRRAAFERKIPRLAQPVQSFQMDAAVSPVNGNNAF